MILPGHFGPILYIIAQNGEKVKVSMRFLGCFLAIFGNSGLFLRVGGCIIFLPVIGYMPGWALRFSGLGLISEQQYCEDSLDGKF
jgi:hypothetical protein